MDRTESYNGNGGPLGSEVTAGLFRNKVMIDTVNYIYGLAGRDFTVQEVYDIFADLEDHIEMEQNLNSLNTSDCVNRRNTVSSYNVKEMMSKKERLAPGHRMCAGCGATIGVRAVLRALHEEDHAVIANATGCLEVSSFMYPYSAWEDSYIHNAFENAGATLSGVETAYKALKNVENFQKTKTLNSSHLVEMVELMISDSSLYQELWNVVMTWFMCVTITELI